MNLTSVRQPRFASVAALIPIILLPVLLRLPAWAAGLRENPLWAAAGLTMPGSSPRPAGLPGFLDMEAGWTTQALGSLAARQWRDGHVPWWDPFSGIGMPLAAEMQSSALFLPYILLLLLPAGTVLLTVSLQWTGGLAMWRFLLRLGLGPVAAVTGAVCFELCACFAWMGPPLFLPVAFLPLFLLGIERARAAALRGRGGGWRTTALAVALSLYAGFPETAYLDGLFALLWALCRVAGLPGVRLGFAVRVVAGGVTGLLLTAPLLWPFLQLLPDASLGPREAISMAALAIPPPGAVQLLTPYALGLPAGLTGHDPSGWLLHIWGRAGGYLGMVLALAAVMGAAVQGPNRWLRLVLLGWVLLFLARILGVPGAGLPFLLVPFQDQIQIFRYSEAAWQLPCCILAAYAIELGGRRRQVWLAGLGLALAAAAAARVAWPLAAETLAAPRYMAVALAWGFASLVAGMIAFAQPRPWVKAAVLVADLSALFMAPLASGYRSPVLDWPAIRFLQANIGLQRFATLGPFQPNYGAMFGIASVNHNYLPVPSIWTDHVQAHLRPGADPVLFIGNFPPDAPGRPTNAEIMAARLPAYAALGVKYVLAPAGPNPFNPPPPDRTPGLAAAVTLDPGASLSGTVTTEKRAVAAMTLTIGTFKGLSTGMLQLELCGEQGCADGQADLDGAPDNEGLRIPMSRPVDSTGELRWTLRHLGGAPVAIWRWPAPDGPQPDFAPRYLSAAIDPVRVYADPIMSIFELPGPAPYFSVRGGPCVLTPRGRTKVDAQCDGPSTLVRRELSMPGWRVRLDGADTGLGREDTLFQAVALPAGVSRAVFRYQPPGAPAFMALFAAGVLGLLPWDRVLRWSGARRSRRASAGNSTP